MNSLLQRLKTNISHEQKSVGGLNKSNSGLLLEQRRPSNLGEGIRTRAMATGGIPKFHIEKEIEKVE